MTPKLMFAACLAIACADSGFAGLTAYEPFDYSPVGADIVGYGGGGSFGFSDNWHGNPTALLGSGSLMPPTTMVASIGNHVTADAAQVNRYVLRTLTQPIGADNSTVYISFLMRAEDTVGGGAYNGWFALALNTGTREVTVGKSSFHSQYKIEGNTSHLALTSVPVVANQTHLFVLRADFLPGNDVFRLYVDPTVGQPEPISANATMLGFKLGIVHELGLFGPGAYGIDELRVGTTWSDVTPIPEPSGIVLFIGAMLLTLGFRKFAQHLPTTP